jgi:hypothetical protein
VSVERVSPAALSGSAAARRYGDLPGWELVSAGLADVAAGRSTLEAALVRSASRRLRELGLDIPAAVGEGETLYDLTRAAVGDAQAHSRYNALRRRLASFLRAASHAPPG